MNDNTAIALSYGFFRRKEFKENEATNVAFIDVGHAKATVTIASFTQKKVKIIAHWSNRNLGARNFDASILHKVGQEFFEKHKIDPR